MGVFDNLDLSQFAASGANPFGVAGAAPASAVQTTPQAAAGPPQGLLAGAGADPDASPAAAPQTGLRGLLSRLAAPSEDGLTLADKLFASGSILQGNSDEASKYLENRRVNVEKTKATADKLKAAQLGAQVLASSFDEKGNFDFAGYVQKMARLGMSPSMEDIAKAAALRTKLEPVNMGMEGGADSFDPYRGTVSQVIAPRAKPAQAPPGYRFTADGNGVELIPGYAEGVEAKAAAERKGKPLAGRSGAVGKPKSWGASEVHWGG